MFHTVYFPSSKSSSAFVQIWLGTTLFQTLALYLLLYLAIGVIMVSVYGKLFPGMRDPVYTRAFEGVGLILGFIFTIWNMSYLKGYSDGPKKLDTLMTNIENYARTYFDLLKPAHTICSLKTKLKTGAPIIALLPLTSDKRRSSAEETSEQTDTSTYLAKQHVLENMQETLNVCIAMISKSYHLFSTEERDFVENLDMQTGAIYSHSNMDKFDIFTILHSRLISLSRYLQTEEVGYFRSNDLTMLNSDYKAIRTAFSEVEASMYVTEPPIFNKIIFSILFVYFVLWVPYVLWVILGPVATIIVYPVMMMFLTVLVIVREWLGDPFNNSRQIRYMDFYEWRYKRYARIAHAFAETLHLFRIQNFIDEVEYVKHVQNFKRIQIRTTPGFAQTLEEIYSQRYQLPQNPTRPLTLIHGQNFVASKYQKGQNDSSATTTSLQTHLMTNTLPILAQEAFSYNHDVSE